MVVGLKAEALTLITFPASCRWQDSDPLVMGKASELPEDILTSIVQRLPGVEDTVRFGAVCTSWNSAANQEKRSGKLFGPWLMFAKSDNDNMPNRRRQGGARSCYNLSSNKLFNLSLPELQGRRCWGTSHGWLFTLGRDGNIFLFHPFNRAKIYFPSQDKFRPQELSYSDSHHMCRQFIRKVAISSNPADSSHPVVAMVVYGEANHIAFASQVDKSWTHIDTICNNNVIFFRGSFYCVDGYGALFICNINTPHPSSQLLSSCPPRLIGIHPSWTSRMFYLVEICRHLYLISRCGQPCKDKIYGLHVEARDFSAFVFDFERKIWVPVKDLNGHAVLLGNNTSCALLPSQYSELWPNCIYFTDDQTTLYNNGNGLNNDMGVYDLKKKTIMKPFYEINQPCSKFSRPFFFTPSLA